MIHVNADDHRRLAAAFGRLPAELRHRIAVRVLSRLADMTRTRVVDLDARRIDVAEKHVRERTHVSHRHADITVKVRSDWIPLIKLGARQTRSGVTVRARGSYAHAFIATSRVSGGPAVMRREGPPRTPVNQLFGPNPAHDITNNPDDYLDLMVDVAQTHMLPRMLHEIERALPR